MSNFKVLLTINVKLVSSFASTLEDVKETVLGQGREPGAKYVVTEITSETLQKL